MAFVTSFCSIVVMYVFIRGIAGCYEDVVEYHRLGREIKRLKAENDAAEAEGERLRQKLEDAIRRWNRQRTELTNVVRSRCARPARRRT